MKKTVKKTEILIRMKMLLLIVAIAGFGLTACDKEEEIVTPQLKVDGEAIFDATGGTQTIAITANCEWQLISQADWLSFSVESGTGNAEVIITATEYVNIQGREETVEVRFEGGNIPIKISQKGLEAVMLNDEASANCYLVNFGEGLYAVKTSYKGNSLTEAIGDWTTASLLWQDKKGLITKISSNPEENLMFIDISDNTGNAVVCVKNAAGEILWSWHLWVADFDPDVTAFTTPEDYGDGSRWTFMDRHLGATVATPGSTGAFGLIYQWGRKDPFTASAAATEEERKIYDINGNELDNFHIMASNNGSLSLSILNPMTFYTVSYETGDWRDDSDDDLWGGVSLKKTIYDPCPVGWKLPVSDEAGKTPYGFLNRNNTTWIDNGRLFNETDWWLAGSGTRVLATGELNINIFGDTYGGLWTGTHGSTNPDPEYPALY